MCKARRPKYTKGLAGITSPLLLIFNIFRNSELIGPTLGSMDELVGTDQTANTELSFLLLTSALLVSFGLYKMTISPISPLDELYPKRSPLYSTNVEFTLLSN